MLPVTAMPKEVDTTIGVSGEIISFARIIEAEKTVSIGTSIDDLELPETVTAVVRTAVALEEDSEQDLGSKETVTTTTPTAVVLKAVTLQQDSISQETATTATRSEWEENIVEIPVTWTSQPGYDKNIKGEYVFRPAIEHYTISTDLPEITVTVDEVLPSAVVLGLGNLLTGNTYEIWVGGVQVSDLNKDNISGTGISGNISYDPATSTLTLDGATITAVYEKTIINFWNEEEEHQYGIYADIPNLKIVLMEENTISCPDASNKYSNGIYTTRKLEISGNGSLYVNTGRGSVSYGINSRGELTIKSGTITSISDADWSSFAIYGSIINISGGDVTARSSAVAAYSMLANSSYNISGGNITVTGRNGLGTNYISGTINISGGEITSNVNEKAIYGVLNFEGGMVIAAAGERALNGTFNLIKGIATASTNKDGSNVGPYDADHLENYKYLKIESAAITHVIKNTDTHTSYETLQEAVDAVEGGQTIQLLKDINLTTTVTIANNTHKSFTLDLNGKTLDGGSNPAITHSGTGELTIQGSGRVQNNGISISKGAIYNQNTGSIIISGATIQGNETGILNYTTGAINISYGTVSGNIGIFNNSRGYVNVSGGTVQSTGGNAIYTNEGGNITISGNAKITSTNPNTNDATIRLWFSNYFYPITLTVNGGTIENTAGGNAIIKQGNSSGELIANISIPNGKSALIKAGGHAMNFAPTFVRATVTASEDVSGTPVVTYNASDITNYKYIKFEPLPDTTATNFELTSKRIAPVTGGTPATSITDDEYTGTIAWSDNPTMFLGSRDYTATVTLTAKEGYTFSGVAENAFSYDGATSVTNTIGSDKTMTITIVFPQTMARTLQQVTITTPPTKTTYYYGENFDKSGMIVKASYDDGTIDENFTDYIVDQTEPLILSDNFITLTAEGTTIKITQAIAVIKKTPTTADLVYDLTAVDYDNTEKPVSVTAAPEKSLGAMTIKYNGSTTPPTNAGTYSIRVDIAESTQYNAATDLSLGNYTINKIDYTGTSTLSESILVDGKIGASITLPDIPEGANYGTPAAQGAVRMTDMSISGNTLIYTAPKSTVGQSGTMTIPVADATNYKDYNIVVTITYTAKAPQMIAYATTAITKIYGDTKFVNPLTQDDIKGTITYTSDDTSIATVNPSSGEVTIVSVGDGSVTITATAMETDTHAQATASYIVTISKKVLILKADDKNMIQGDELPNFTFTAIGLVNGDTVITLPTMSTTTNGATVGTFDITPSGGVVGNASSYDITYTEGTLTVAEGLFIATVTNGTGSGNYAEGAIVRVTANDRSGYTFTGWSGTDVTFADVAAKTTTFTMPAKAVTVAANYRQNSFDGGGSGSSGASSSVNSSSVIVTLPTADKPNDPTQGEIKVLGTADGQGNITVNITNKTVTDAFDKALSEAKKNGNEQNGITVVLRVDTARKTGSNVTVNLPKNVQDTIITKKIVNTIVVVENPDIRIGMDLATVQEINKQAKSDVNITAIRKENDKLTDEGKKAIGSRPVFELKVNYGSNKQVQSFGTGSVSVSIPYTLGANEKAENVQAVYVDGNGKAHWLVNSVYDSMEKVLGFTTNHFSIYGVGYKEDAPVFTDIANHWAKEDIEFVIKSGLFRGTSDTTFSPNAVTTRGMFITALGRLANVDVSSYNKSSFTDVKMDAYYMGYIEWASKNNIINGIGNGKFAPDQSITREQMAVIMQNYAKVMGFMLPQVHAENDFADERKINTYAKDAVKQIQMAGIMNGKSGNLFDPQGIATRAEASAVLRRFVEMMNSVDTMSY
jgi:uncharacterized repeat protein (TIGR02543 family)